MLKKIYKIIHKIKFRFLKHNYKIIPLNDSDTARKFLETAYKKNNKVTNYGEKFINKASIDLSIIIPVYNSECFLNKCIDSCIQKTSFSYEIILIDDESSDHSGKICDEYAEKFDFISVFHIKNSGVSFARNLGIINSKGRFLMFLDSDDFIENDSIENLLKNSENYDIVQGLYYKVENDNIFYKSKRISPAEVHKFSMEYGYAWGKIYKREIFENLKFPLGYWFEDMINDLVIYPSYDSKFLTNHFVYNYILNQKGITFSSKNSLKILDSYFVLEELINNFDKFNLEFTPLHFKRFLFQASYQIYVRLRRYDIIYMKNTFVLLSDLAISIINKFNIEKNSLSKLDKELIDSFETKNFKKWKDISVFYG